MVKMAYFDLHIFYHNKIKLKRKKSILGLQRSELSKGKFQIRDSNLKGAMGAL